MDFMVVVLTAVLAAVPGLVTGLYAWWKAYAASTPAKWDDKTIEAIEEVARRVVGSK